MPATSRLTGILPDFSGAAAGFLWDFSGAGSRSRTPPSPSPPSPSAPPSAASAYVDPSSSTFAGTRSGDVSVEISAEAVASGTAAGTDAAGKSSPGKSTTVKIRQHVGSLESLERLGIPGGDVEYFDDVEAERAAVAEYLESMGLWEGLLSGSDEPNLDPATMRERIDLYSYVKSTSEKKTGKGTSGTAADVKSLRPSGEDSSGRRESPSDSAAADNILAAADILAVDTASKEADATKEAASSPAPRMDSIVRELLEQGDQPQCSACKRSTSSACERSWVDDSEFGKIAKEVLDLVMAGDSSRAEASSARFGASSVSSAAAATAGSPDAAAATREAREAREARDARERADSGPDLDALARHALGVLTDAEVVTLLGAEKLATLRKDPRWAERPLLTARLDGHFDVGLGGTEGMDTAGKSAQKAAAGSSAAQKGFATSAEGDAAVSARGECEACRGASASAGSSCRYETTSECCSAKGAPKDRDAARSGNCTACTAKDASDAKKTAASSSSKKSTPSTSEGVSGSASSQRLQRRERALAASETDARGPDRASADYGPVTIGPVGSPFLTKGPSSTTTRTLIKTTENKDGVQSVVLQTYDLAKQPTTVYRRAILRAFARIRRDLEGHWPLKRDLATAVDNLAEADVERVLRSLGMTHRDEILEIFLPHSAPQIRFLFAPASKC